MSKSIITSLFTLLLIIAAVSCDNHQNQLKKFDGSWDGCIVGFYPENGNEKIPQSNFDEINEFENLIDQKVGSVVWFPTWDDEFPLEACKKINERGITPHLTWEIFWPSIDPNNARGTGENGFEGFNELLIGKYDKYIDRFASDAKKFGEPVLIRFLHEFNGNWYVWSGNKNGKENGGPEKVKAVWRYVVDRFNQVGAENVQWLWVPHGPSTDLSSEPWNNVSNYWPGDEYVDWIGLDGYNFYPKDPWGGTRPYRDFDNCFRALYDSCAVLGNQPMMIAEFGTGEFEHESSNKSTWIKDAFSKIKNEYPRLKIFTWFNINKELDWRVNSSEESLQAFREAMKDPYFIGSPFNK